MRGRRHIQATLLQARAVVPFEYEAAWAPKTVWAFWRKAESLEICALVGSYAA